MQRARHVADERALLRAGRAAERIALWMAGPGVAVGLFGALLLSWLITSSVRGLDVNSPMTYAIVGFLQLTIAVAAAAIPGRRAGRASPLAALRAE